VAELRRQHRPPPPRLKPRRAHREVREHEVARPQPKPKPKHDGVENEKDENDRTHGLYLARIAHRCPPWLLPFSLEGEGGAARIGAGGRRGARGRVPTQSSSWPGLTRPPRPLAPPSRV